MNRRLPPACINPKLAVWEPRAKAFSTPIMYGVDMIPEHLLKYFYLNPMTPIIVAYRQILYYKEVPDLSTLGYASILGIAFLLIGFYSFSKLQRHFAEEL